MSLSERAPPMAAVLIAGSTASGLAGVPWYIAVPACAAGLSAIALPKYLALLPKAQMTGNEHAVRWAMLGSALNASGAAAGSYALGALVGYVFEVGS